MSADFKKVKLNAHVAFLKVSVQFKDVCEKKKKLKIRLLNTICLKENSKILYLVVASC